MRDEDEPRGRRHLQDGGPAVPEEAEAGDDRVAERAGDRRFAEGAPGGGDEGLDDALAAVGHRDEVDRGVGPRGGDAPGHRAGGVGGGEAALELVGGDDDAGHGRSPFPHSCKRIEEPGGMASSSWPCGDGPDPHGRQGHEDEAMPPGRSPAGPIYPRRSAKTQGVPGSVSCEGGVERRARPGSKGTDGLGSAQRRVGAPRSAEAASVARFISPWWMLFRRTM